MSVAWGMAWLLFIWAPFQLLGGDPLYRDLRRDKSLKHKSLVIVKMIVITEVGYLVGYACNTTFVETYMSVIDKAVPLVLEQIKTLGVEL